MQDFAAIDFETANNERSSVCSVGVVIVRGGKIEKKFYSLIKPEPEYYNYWCSRVHGLCITDTDDAPIFPEVWQQIQPLIEELPLGRTTKHLMRVALKPHSASIRWIIPTTNFIALALPHADNGQASQAPSTQHHFVADMT